MHSAFHDQVVTEVEEGHLTKASAVVVEHGLQRGEEVVVAELQRLVMVEEVVER